jgi:hypothetical protein
MLTLHVEAESYDVLVKNAWAALGLELKGQRPAVPEKAVEPNGATETKRKPGRPAAVKEPEPTPTQATPFDVETPAGKTITLEQVRAGLQEYANKMGGSKDQTVGIVKARELLSKFVSVKGTPCQKISEVQDSDYAKVLALCAA